MASINDGRLKEEEEAMEYLSKKKYPLNAKDYDLYEEVGQGVSATVYRALCIPLNQVLAIKVFDLERCNNHLDNIRREVHMMGLIDHPNVLRAYCSFMAGTSLWIVMPYMAGGSCLHIMKSAYPEGFEQSVIATLLHEVLKALAYLHAHGHIHRDVKAGNILVDSRGAVKLADFGVSACMFDSGDRQRSRNTFVGTPCWMAPEVMQQLHGYDFKADIWSFGITALELAHGHAPFSKYPPMKVLLMTLQNAPPGLDYERDKKFSKSFKEIVAACLVKDPKERPTSEKLLKHQFFKHARSNEFLAQAILHGLSPLGDRFRMLKGKEAALLVRNKDVYGDKEQLSQQEYIRGISAWNFDLEDLKRQASLIQDCEGISNTENQDLSGKQPDGLDNLAVKAERLSVEKLNDSNAAKADPSQEDETNGFDNLQCVKGSPASFTKHHLQALEGHLDIHVDDVDACSSNQKGVSHSNFKQTKELSPSMNDKGTGSLGGDDLEHIIQDTPNSFINPLVGQSINLSTIATSVVPSLQCLLQQNAMKREQILRLIRYVDQTTEGNHTEFVKAAGSDEHLLLSSASARERELQSQVIHMQQSIGKLVEELQREKIKNAELERQLRAFFDKGLPARCS